MLKYGALVAVLTIGAPLAALAQSHSPEDEAACTPDVLRLCQHFIPKRPEIIACLTERKNELSPPCYLVFSRPAQKTEDERRRRKPVGQNSRN
jgi:hypothetical protein